MDNNKTISFPRKYNNLKLLYKKTIYSNIHNKYTEQKFKYIEENLEELK